MTSVATAPSRLLLAVSPRWQQDARLDGLIEYAQRLGATLVLVHVVDDSGNNPDENSPGERLVEQMKEYIVRNNVNVETQVLCADDVAGAILKAADDTGCSTIIIGLASKGILSRLLEGNIAQEIIAGAHLPVLLLPPEWKGRV
jgi:nucleotide-binding universal stress UspA family protein